MTTRIALLGNRQVQDLHSQIVAIYRNAFTLPPYSKPEAEVDEFSHSLPHLLDREGFRFVGAFDSNSGQIVGFAYGYTCTAGQWWYETVKPALSPDNAYRLEGAFQFAEIAVAPSAQGRGIGSRLHDRLLSKLRHERAVLSTLQADTVAHHLYQRRGWVVLRTDFFFPGAVRRYQIMGLDLTKIDTLKI